jgi:hypothetical protein
MSDNEGTEAKSSGGGWTDKERVCSRRYLTIIRY